jgi:L-ascorbate metabolism protein UlaG (beta-lactamase superfamily)
MAIQYVHNSALRTLPFAGWQGTPVNEKGLFENLEFPFSTSYKEVWKWQTGKKPQKQEKQKDKWKMEVLLNNAIVNGTTNAIYWLGHASFLIRYNGITLLIDPVFYPLPFIKRHSALPCDVRLLKNIDYLLISHDHRDHCDEKSLQLISKNNPQLVVLSGLKMDSILRPIFKTNNLQCAGWWQQYIVQTPDINISFLPTRHWCRRGLFDINKRLWGSFMIELGHYKIYFGGDSGYDNHFRQVGEFFGDIDVCMIGCGAYKPSWFMSPSHTSPEEAVQAFHDLGARQLIPMHYGTFDLSDEPMGEPYRKLAAMQADENLPAAIVLMKVGEGLEW